MRAVVDTNVLVSALLKPESVPSQLIERALKGGLIVVYDHRVLKEYVDVLRRPKFGFEIRSVATLLLRLSQTGERVAARRSARSVALDPDDQIFLDVAEAAHVDALVTGNRQDFPANCGTQILSPVEALARLGPDRVVVRALNYNIEQRYDGDWARVDDGSFEAGTIADWQAYCEERGLKLDVRKVPQQRWDPLESALENLREIYGALDVKQTIGR